MQHAPLEITPAFTASYLETLLYPAMLVARTLRRITVANMGLGGRRWKAKNKTIVQNGLTLLWRPWRRIVVRLIGAAINGAAISRGCRFGKWARFGGIGLSDGPSDN